MTSLALHSKSIPTTNYISEAAYWAYYYDQKPKHEWNNGQLERVYVSDFLTFQVHIWFANLLYYFLNSKPIGNLVGLEMGFRIVLPIKTVIRRPDLAIVLNTNPVPLQPLDCSYAGIFDLCIEFLSDSKPQEAYRDTVIKKAEYLAAGVPEYYILHHDTSRCVFYTRDANNNDYVPIKPHNGIIASPLLPGFQFRLRDLKLLPHVNAMVNDPVYQNFVLPEWQEDRLKVIEAGHIIHEAERLAKDEMLIRKKIEHQIKVESLARKRAERQAKVEAAAHQAEAAAHQAEAAARRVETAARQAAEAEVAKLKQLLAEMSKSNDC